MSDSIKNEGISPDFKVNRSRIVGSTKFKSGMRLFQKMFWKEAAN
jgi:hypothetical protein